MRNASSEMFCVEQFELRNRLCLPDGEAGESGDFDLLFALTLPPDSGLEGDLGEVISSEGKFGILAE